MLPITIQPAQEKDFTTIYTIWLQGIHNIYPTIAITPYIKEAFKNNFKNCKYPFQFWIATIDNEIVGWCSILQFSSFALKQNNQAEISTYVNASRQHSGVGKALMVYVLKEAQERGIEYVLGFANTTNKKSINMSMQAGMKICGKTALKTILIKEFL